MPVKFVVLLLCVLQFGCSAVNFEGSGAPNFDVRVKRVKDFMVSLNVRPELWPFYLNSSKADFAIARKIYDYVDQTYLWGWSNGCRVPDYQLLIDEYGCTYAAAKEAWRQLMPNPPSREVYVKKLLQFNHDLSINSTMKTCTTDGCPESVSVLFRGDWRYAWISIDATQLYIRGLGWLVPEPGECELIETSGGLGPDHKAFIERHCKRKPKTGER